MKTRVNSSAREAKELLKFGFIWPRSFRGHDKYECELFTTTTTYGLTMDQVIRKIVGLWVSL